MPAVPDSAHEAVSRHRRARAEDRAPGRFWAVGTANATTPSPSAVQHANRRVAWLVALSGLLAVVGQAAPEFAAQSHIFPAWWNVSGLVVVCAIILLAAVGLWLPPRMLRLLWIGIPVIVIGLQLASYGVYGGPPEGVSPWVWRLEPTALTLLVFVLRPAAAIVAAIGASATVALSAVLFTGTLPDVVAWNTPFHMSEIGFVVIFLGIRNRVALLTQSEEMARVAAENAAAREVEERRHAELTRLVHDEVLSVLNATLKFSGPAPPVLREEAGRAILALDDATDPVDTADAYLPTVAAAKHVETRLRSALPDVTITATGDDPVRVSALEAVTAAAVEAARNAIRHANASHVTGVIRVDRGGIDVLIADDGDGFDTDELKPGRLGLSDSIIARLDDIGGEARIDSAPGAGTTVRLTWTPADT